jgi:hypothetical protein
VRGNNLESFSIVSAKENIAPEPEEKPATGVSEDVKSVIMKRLL